MNAKKIKTILGTSIIASLVLTFSAFNDMSVYGETLNTKTTHTASIPITSGSYYSPIGKVTYFTDYWGDNQQVLGPKDCATKGSVDNPPDNTIIYLFKGTHGLSTPGNNDRWDIVYKNDWGSLPNAVLDIRLPEFDYFGVPESQGYFTGYYFHA